MRYKIVYDTPGRLRVRCGQYAFSREQGYGIASLLLSRKGVLEAVANAANGSVLVIYQNGWREEILDALDALQRDTLPVGAPSDADSVRAIDGRFQRQLAGLLIRRLVVRPLLPMPVRMAATLWRGIGYWRRAAGCLLRGRMGVAVLDGASVAAAICQRHYSTAGSIMFLLSLSELLEDYTRRRTKNALTRSLAVNVDSVWLVRKDQTEVSLPMSQLSAGDHIRVRTGAVIPVDGTVTCGEAMVNEASMTGEPLPVPRREGATVYAGTVVEEGSIVLRVTALSGETRINRIIDLIDHSEELKAGVQSRAEHLADAIVPFSFLGALGVWVFTRNLTRALSVLMVDYSCAIKLSTPICVISAMREASAHRVMVKGGKYLEAFAQADTILFDKTGTLTEACPRVAQVLAFGGYSREEALKIAACIEEHFPHSMARAVVRQARAEGLRHEEEHAEVEYVVAHGVATTLHGKRALIGSHHFIAEDEGIQISPAQQEALRQYAGCSLLYLAIGGELAGVICIDDPPRPEAARAIAELRSLGIQRVVMITGDGDSAASTVAKALGVDEYRAQVLPEDKAVMVQHFKQGGRKVIMVGDGVNDSPALAAADVSVAMRDGSDIAREVADITLLSADLRELAMLRRLSGRLFSRIDRNYRFIVGFNTALLLLGLGGVLRPTATALWHNISTMAISAGSMRPLLKAPPERPGTSSAE